LVSICCQFCLLSGRGLCDERTTRPAESYRLRCDVVCYLEASWMRGPGPLGGCCSTNSSLIRISAWSPRIPATTCLLDITVEFTCLYWFRCSNCRHVYDICLYHFSRS